MSSSESSNLQSVVGGFFFGEVNENLIFPFPHFSDAQVEMAKEMTSAVDSFAKDNIVFEWIVVIGFILAINGIAAMAILALPEVVINWRLFWVDFDMVLFFKVLL